MSPAPTPDPACPGCGAVASPAHRPFCSQGCRDRDLLQWLSEGYRLPIDHEADAEADAEGLDRRARPPL